MFTENHNMFAPKMICPAKITYEYENDLYRLPCYRLRVNFYSDDPFFYNPDIIYKNYLITPVGTTITKYPERMYYDIVVDEPEKFYEGQEFTAYIDKNDEKIMIFLKDVQRQ